MKRRWLLVPLVLVISAVLGCSSGNSLGSSPPPPSGNAPVSLALTDTPPAGVTVLSFEVTVTSAMLNPGNVQLVSSPITIEITKLETEAAFLSTLSVPAGTYQSITIGFSNPEITFKNDTGATLAGCASGQVCELKPSVAANVTFSGSPFPITVGGGTPVGLLVDLNVANVLDGTLGVNFNATNGVVVTKLPSVQATGVLEEIEDLVGQVTAKDAVNNQFTLQTPQGSLTIHVDATTQFEDFNNAGCSSANFACVQVNQIVEVDLKLQGSGDLLAEKVELEDNDVNEAEVEGVIVSLGAGTPPASFQMVALEEIPDVPGLSVGSLLTVNLSGGTSFSIDDNGLNTSGFSFNSAADLLVGQEVQVKRLTTSSGTTINADRVQLERSRLTAKVASKLTATNFTVNNLPTLFTSATPPITTIEVDTSSSTEFEPSGTSAATLNTGDTVSLRGLLFKTSGNPVLLADKVRKR